MMGGHLKRRGEPQMVEAGTRLEVTLGAHLSGRGEEQVAVMLVLLRSPTGRGEDEVVLYQPGHRAILSGHAIGMALHSETRASPHQREPLVT